VHAQERRRLGADRALVVGGARAVRRPHLDQPRTRARQHVGDPEAVADLDQLAPRDHHLAAFGQRGEDEEEGAGVVVDDEGRLGAGEPAQDVGDVILAGAARARPELVLEVRVPAPDLGDAFKGGRGQGSPSEVRVHDHARGVEHPPEPRRPGRRELLDRQPDEVAGIATRADLVPRPGERAPGRGERERPLLAGEPRITEELVDRGQIPEPHVEECRPDQNAPLRRCSGRSAPDDLDAVMTQLTARAPRSLARSPRPASIALLALALTVATVAAIFSVRDRAYRGEALPGARVLDVDLGGRTRAETEQLVARAVESRLARPVTIATDGREVTIRLSSVLRLDEEATTAAVLAAGRDSTAARARALLSPTPRTLRVEPVLRLRRIPAGVLVGELNRAGSPAVPARIALRGTVPVVTPGRTGRRVHERALFDAFRHSVASGATRIDAGFRPAPPPIGDAAALEAATTARVVLSAPVELRFRGRSVGRIDPERLARLLRFQPTAGRYVVALADGPLARSVKPLLDPWRHRATNARFAIDGATVRTLPSKPGYDLDPTAVAGAVTAAAYSSTSRVADLTLREVPADLTTREALALGIRSRLVSYTTDMGPSSWNRIHNVHLMADYIDGTIVRPGQIFSFNAVVGPRTPERGFVEGQMIVGSLLLPSIGGGVCQTATTLFNDAFEAGLPILERHNHSFYITHYPMGRDATVSWGGPDFKFRNDLAHAILIKASYTDSTLTFAFYGTPEGRKVTSSTSPATNFREPTLTYALDPAAPAGSMRVESGSHEQGFDVTVRRTVSGDGRVLRRDAFKSEYVAVGDTAVYGPGSEIPGPYFVIPTT
jgi:vancomycin resistance protein YoaR